MYAGVCGRMGLVKLLILLSSLLLTDKFFPVVSSHTLSTHPRSHAHRNFYPSPPLSPPLPQPLPFVPPPPLSSPLKCCMRCCERCSATGDLERDSYRCGKKKFNRAGSDICGSRDTTHTAHIHNYSYSKHTHTYAYIHTPPYAPGNSTSISRRKHALDSTYRLVNL